jgi:hypothetical protein
MSDEEVPGRIRSLTAYRAGQPDLDVFKPCFQGYVSPRFCGSDIDAMYFAPHGLWERNAHILIQEHKQSPGSWVKSMGQWWALNQLAECGQRLIATGSDYGIAVVVTYGDSRNPTTYNWLPVYCWASLKGEHQFSKIKTRQCSIKNVNTMPHRQWIAAISKKRQDDIQGTLA